MASEIEHLMAGDDPIDGDAPAAAALIINYFPIGSIVSCCCCMQRSRAMSIIRFEGDG
jgi:hypothetical protein